MKKFKRILAVGMTAALMASMAGCGGSSDDKSANSGSDNSGDKEEIRVVTYFAGSDVYANVWKQVCEDYMAEHPNVTIVDESQPTAGTNDLFKTKVQADLSAGTSADLVLYYTGEAYTPTFIETGEFVTFDDILADDPEWAANFKESPMENVSYDGEQWALPFIGYYEGLFYNQALFDEYDLEYPTTWDNIMAAAKVFSENDIVTLSASLGMPYYMTENFILAAAGEENHRNYFDPSWETALDCIAELYQAGGLPKDTFTISEDDVRLLFKEGKAAMMLNGSWCTSDLEDNPDMRIISMPQLPGGTGGENCAIAGFSAGWYMRKDAYERSDETLNFLKYLTSPEIMAEFIAYGGSPAVNCEAPENSSELLKSAVEMLDKATYQDAALDSQLTHEAYESLNGGLQYLCEGQMTSKEVLEQAEALNTTSE